MWMDEECAECRRRTERFELPVGRRGGRLPEPWGFRRVLGQGSASNAARAWTWSVGRRFGAPRCEAVSTPSGNNAPRRVFGGCRLRGGRGRPNVLHLGPSPPIRPRRGHVGGCQTARPSGCRFRRWAGALGEGGGWRGPRRTLPKFPAPCFQQAGVAGRFAWMGRAGRCRLHGRLRFLPRRSFQRPLHLPG